MPPLVKEGKMGLYIGNKTVMHEYYLHTSLKVEYHDKEATSRVLQLPFYMWK